MIPPVRSGGAGRRFPNLIGKEASMAKAKKAGFGGYAINFKGCSDTLESVMGSSPIGPSEMTKKIWAYVKRKKLAKK
jgi:chromatin remodeling complex protein RSC6